MAFGEFCNMDKCEKGNNKMPCYKRISLSVIIDVGLYVIGKYMTLL